MLTGDSGCVISIGLSICPSGLQSCDKLSVLCVETLVQAQDFLRANHFVAVVYGPSLPASEISEFIRELASHREDVAHIVLYAGSVNAFQTIIEEDLVFYLVKSPVPEIVLRRILEAALESVRVPTLAKQTFLSADEIETLYGLAFRFMRYELTATLHDLEAYIAESVAASSAACLLLDHSSKSLVRATNKVASSPISITSGLLGFVARTVESINIVDLSTDPRYDQDADGDICSPRSRMIAEPITSLDNEEILGVVVASRDYGLSPFTPNDECRLRSLARHMSPFLAHSGARSELIPMSDNLQADRGIFRKEALDHLHAAEVKGTLLGRVPRWIRWSHVLIVIFIGSALLYVSFAKVEEVISGPAVIRLVRSTPVTASAYGTLEGWSVVTGDHVKQGQLLAHIQIRPVESPFMNDSDVRAPVAGIVSEISLRPGEPVSPGMVLLGLSSVQKPGEVTALLPGAYAPEINEGMKMLLKIDGYRQSSEVLSISSVGNSVISSSDAGRLIGGESTQPVPVNGSVVVVRGLLTKPTFLDNHDAFNYHDGMLARAQVSIKEQPLIFVLIPGLRELTTGARISLRHRSD